MSENVKCKKLVLVFLTSLFLPHIMVPYIKYIDIYRVQQ